MIESLTRRNGTHERRGRDGARLPRIGVKWLLIPVVVTVEGVLALGIANAPLYASLLAMALIGLMLVVVSPTLPALAVFAAAPMYARVGAFAVDLSVADVVLTGAVAVCLVHVPWASPRLQSVLRWVAIYSVVLAVPVVAHLNEASAFEWLHRLVLTGGAVCVGATLTGRSRVREALLVTVAVALVIAAGCVAWFVQHGFEPAYPFGIQKNPAGFFLVAGYLVMHLGRRILELPRSVDLVTRVLLLVGLVLTQSRGAALALAVVLVATVCLGLGRGKGVVERQGIVLAVIAGVGLAGFAASSLQSEFASDDRFNAVNSREAAYDIAWDTFRDGEVFGAGLRYFKQAPDRGGEPHNVIFVTLAESGLVGLVALALLVHGVTRELRRCRSNIAVVALAVFAGKIVSALADIYWVAGTQTIGWLLVGVAVGASDSTGPDDVVIDLAEEERRSIAR